MTCEMNKCKKMGIIIPNECLEFGCSDYNKKLKAIIENLINILEPFAEKPTELHNSYPCHLNITTKEKCARCRKAFAAYYAIENAKEVING